MFRGDDAGGGSKMWGGLGWEDRRRWCGLGNGRDCGAVVGSKMRLWHGVSWSSRGFGLMVDGVKMRLERF